MLRCYEEAEGEDRKNGDERERDDGYAAGRDKTEPSVDVIILVRFSCSSSSEGCSSQSELMCFGVTCWPTGTSGSSSFVR